MLRAVLTRLKSHRYKKYSRVDPLPQREIKKMSTDVQRGVRLNFDDMQILKNLKKNLPLRFCLMLNVLLRYFKILKKIITYIKIKYILKMCEVRLLVKCLWNAILWTRLYRTLWFLQFHSKCSLFFDTVIKKMRCIARYLTNLGFNSSLQILLQPNDFQIFFFNWYVGISRNCVFVTW